MENNKHYKEIFHWLCCGSSDRAFIAFSATVALNGDAKNSKDLRY
jgi:hypothetical protein